MEVLEFIREAVNLVQCELTTAQRPYATEHVKQPTLFLGCEVPGPLEESPTSANRLWRNRNSLVHGEQTTVHRDSVGENVASNPTRATSVR
jgi:hypothetical protein